MISRREAVLCVAVVLALLAGLAIGSGFARGATPRSQAEPVPSWAPVVLPSEAPHAATAPVTVQRPARDPEDDRATGGASLPAQVSDAPSVTPPTKGMSPDVSSRATKPIFSPTANGYSISGSASWFCSATSACTKGYPASGLYAAAGPALRVGAWRGRYVTVNGLRVRLIDWCGCPDGRVIDLYASAFSRLAPLSAGVVKVTVRW